MDANTILENSLSAKEKIISELNTELHNIETTLSNEREHNLNELKKLKALLNEKVITRFYLFMRCLRLGCYKGLLFSTRF